MSDNKMKECWNLTGCIFNSNNGIRYMRCKREDYGGIDQCFDDSITEQAREYVQYPESIMFKLKRYQDGDRILLDNIIQDGWRFDYQTGRWYMVLKQFKNWCNKYIKN